MERIEYSIIIPSYNEDGNLEVLLENFNSFILSGIEVIVVDNGSTTPVESYIPTINRSWLRIVRTEINLGYGGGIKLGLSHARGDVFCWTHGDGQVPAQKVIEMLVNEYSGFQDTVLKGRRVNRNILDKAFSKSMEYWVRIRLGVRLTEINAQPKIFSRSFYEVIMHNFPSDFSIDLYLLIRAEQLSIPIKEIPIDFNDRVFGSAKGGGSLRGKLSLVKRTVRYINKLRK